MWSLLIYYKNKPFSNSNDQISLKAQTFIINIVDDGLVVAWSNFEFLVFYNGDDFINLEENS